MSKVCLFDPRTELKTPMTVPPPPSQPIYPDLEGRVILVTGGATGIGEAHVRAFCASGAKVAFIDIQEEAGRALAEELSDQGAIVSFLNCDLLDIPALGSAIEIRAPLARTGLRPDQQCRRRSASSFRRS